MVRRITTRLNQQSYFRHVRKQVFIVRHGQTDFNKQGIVQGSGVDASLNDLGKRQAEAFHNAYGNHGFEKVYISKLKRTRESVAPFLANTPFEMRAELNEIGWGIFEGKQVTPKDRAVFKNLVAMWDLGQTHKAIEEGETPNEVAERQKQFLPTLTQKPEEEQVLICMHGRAMRIFICVLLGLPLSEMQKFPHNNLGLYHLEMNEMGHFSLLKENDISHLTYL